MKKKALSLFFPVIISLTAFAFCVLLLIAGLGLSFTMLAFVLILCIGGIFPICCILKNEIDISRHFVIRIAVTLVCAVICAYSWIDINLLADGYILYIPIILSVLTTALYFFIFRRNNYKILFLITNPILYYTIFILAFVSDVARTEFGF